MKSPALYHLNLNVPWLEIHYWGVTSGSLTWWYPISNKQKLDVRLWSKTHHCQHIPARILRLNPGCSDLINVAGRLGRVISFTRRYLYSRALKDWRKIKMRCAGGSHKDSTLRLMGRAGQGWSQLNQGPQTYRDLLLVSQYLKIYLPDRLTQWDSLA